MEVRLSEEARRFVEAQLAQGGYRTPAEMIDAALTQMRRRQAEERLEALLLEGLESGPATPMTEKDWAEIRQEVRRRLEARGPGRH